MINKALLQHCMKTSAIGRSRCRANHSIVPPSNKQIYITPEMVLCFVMLEPCA